MSSTVPPADDPDTWPKTVVVDLPDGHHDDRGSILPLLDVPSKSALIISSKKGTVRANHYHLTDWHYCYVLTGRIEYHHRPHGSAETPEVVVIEEGQMFFTPPMVDHAMVFLEDTEFLTFGRNERDQVSYEADVRRITVVDPASV